MIDRKRLKSVYEDLCYLRDEWTGSIKENYLRISGTILRRLLVDGLLITAWNEIKGKSRPPNFEIVDTDKILGNFATDEIEFFLSAGADYRGGISKAVLLTKGTRKLLKTPMITVPYEKFIYAICMQMKERMGVPSNGLPAKHIKINNTELIKYVCNKLGGAHYNRGIDNTKSSDKYKQLDRLRENKNWLNISLFELDPIYFQFLSIGQIIIRSEDIAIFMDELEHLI